jgi:hypothetical protein
LTGYRQIKEIQTKRQTAAARPKWAKIREKRGQYACETLEIDAKSMIV